MVVMVLCVVLDNHYLNSNIFVVARFVDWQDIDQIADFRNLFSVFFSFVNYDWISKWLRQPYKLKIFKNDSD